MKVFEHKVSPVAQSVQCLATGWTTGRSRFDPRQRREDLSSSLCVQTGSGAHQTSCTMGTGSPFPGGKARTGRDADHSPPSSAEVMNGASMACSGTAKKYKVIHSLLVKPVAFQKYFFCHFFNNQHIL
jgi:hypothetical protein